MEGTNKNLILGALDYLTPFVSGMSYDEWLHVGMSLKLEGFDCSIWDRWSQNDPSRYSVKACSDKWDSFKGKDEPVTGGTIVDMAKKRGWTPAENRNTAMRWDDPIEYDGSFGTPADPAAWTPAEQLKKYLETLFEPDDIIGYVTNDVITSSKRISPGKGEYRRTAGEILDALERHPGDIGAAVGDWNPQAGAWIRFNPLDGNGVKNENVVSYRYALVESDTISLEDQEDIYRKLQLPIAALTYSGGKSLHAIVHVDAEDYRQYSTRVQELYSYLAEMGVSIDRQNKNPSRLTRMPGATRSGKEQKLIAVNIGQPSWDAWKAHIDDQNEPELPGIVSFQAWEEHPVPLAEEMISGILRRGHKMLISGASKSGKSYLLIELAIAIAEGLPWLGFPCRQGTVLYVNLEIDAASFGARVEKVYEAMAPHPHHKKSLLLWDLRGHAQTLDKLVPKLIQAVKDIHLDAVIIDPIYKVITGDENNASDMGQFCNQFDKIATQTGASVIYCHHHAKGSQAGRAAIDRASGSGVFGRDPDAQIDLAELELSEEIVNRVTDGKMRGFRVEMNLREFAPVKPFEIWFDYPVHKVDMEGILAAQPIKGTSEANLAKTSKTSSKRSRHEDLETAYDAVRCGDSIVEIKAVAEYLNVTAKTVKNYLAEFSDEYKSGNGVMWKT